MRGLLLDIDGVLCTSQRPIDGAVEIVRWVPHLFVTNTTSRDRVALARELSSYGIKVSEQESLIPAAAVAEGLRQSSDGRVALFLRPSARRDFADLPCLDDEAEEGASYVVIGDMGSCGIIARSIARSDCCTTIHGRTLSL